jgi:uncharacterized membrane protein YphA (DoxX/SURF4 family)
MALLWTISVLIALVMLMQGGAKFASDGHWVRSFAAWGYAAWFRLLVGVAEVGGAVVLVIPRVARYGATTLAAVMVGAVATQWVQVGLVAAITPAVYLALLIWIAWERRGLGSASPGSGGD